MAASRDNDDSALSQFAEELRAARGKAGLSREDLGAKINYSGSLIGMIESMSRSPSLDFARRCDGVFNMPGTFERMHVRVRAEPLADSFRLFVTHETTAIALHAFELGLVPGLLQTPDYARTLLGSPMGVSEEETDRRVTARLERQAVLDRTEPPPPMYWVVIDEAVLRRPVGGPEVMRAQVEHLIEMARRPNVMMDLTRAGWRKASFSGTNSDNCVEVGVVGRTVAVRDSKEPHGPVLALAPEQWRAFTGQVKDGTLGLA